MQDSTLSLDKPTLLSGYSNFQEYLSHHLINHTFQNLHLMVGNGKKTYVSRLLNNSSPWEYNGFVDVVKQFIDSGFPPSELIKHFEIYHNMTENELSTIDSFWR